MYTYIELANLCEMFGCLPRPGGLLDQDWKLMRGMAFVREAQAERRERDMKNRSKRR